MTTSSCVKIVLAWEKAQLETKCLKEVMEMPCNEYLPVCAKITGANVFQLLCTSQTEFNNFKASCEEDNSCVVVQV